jgi:hypothetical protein
MRGEMGSDTKFYSENPKAKNHLEDRDVNGRLIFKGNRMRGYGLDLSQYTE